MVASRAAVDRCGPGHVYPPLSPSGTEDGQGRGGGAQGQARGATTTEAPSSPAGALPAVRRGRARRVAADRSGRAAGATGEGPAVHRRAARRRRTHGADSGHSWVAWGDQVVEVLRMLDVPAIEQVIAVPKISLDLVPQRSADGRTVGGCADDPGVCACGGRLEALSRREIRGILSGLGSTASGFGQVLDNAVPQGRRGGGARGGLQGSPEQIVDIPVPQGRRRGGGGPQGSLPGRGSTAYVEQIVEIPALGGLQGFLPGQGSSSRRLLPDEDDGFQGVFRTFPQPKKSAKVTRQSSPRVPASASSSELSAHQMPPARESGELVDEPGHMDVQRSRRGLGRRDGGVVLLASGMRGVHAAWRSTVALLWCRDRRWVGGGRRR